MALSILLPSWAIFHFLPGCFYILLLLNNMPQYTTVICLHTHNIYICHFCHHIIAGIVVGIQSVYHHAFWPLLQSFLTLLIHNVDISGHVYFYLRDWLHIRFIRNIERRDIYWRHFLRRYLESLRERFRCRHAAEREWYREAAFSDRAAMTLPSLLVYYCCLPISITHYHIGTLTHDIRHACYDMTDWWLPLSLPSES